MKKGRKTQKYGSTPREALHKAFRFLGYRAHSEYEIERKLARLGFSQKTTESTLKRLRSLKLLDDESFARNWARERVQLRSYGPIRVAAELKQKGIGRALIDQALREAFGQGEEPEQAKKVLRKKFHDQDFKDRRTRYHAAAFLQRRGYRSGVIAEVLKQLPEDEWQDSLETKFENHS